MYVLKLGHTSLAKLRCLGKKNTKSHSKINFKNLKNNLKLIHRLAHDKCFFVQLIIYLLHNILLIVYLTVFLFEIFLVKIFFLKVFLRESLIKYFLKKIL